MQRVILTNLVLIVCAALVHAAGVEIHRVIPSKIIYTPNEDGTINVVLGNTEPSPQQAEVRLVTRWDMDGEREIGKQEVTLAAGEVKSLTFPWNTGAERYGREARAEVIQKGKVTDARSEYFNVIKEWWRVNNCGAGIGGLCGKWAKENDLYPLRKRVFDYYHLKYKTYEHSFYTAGYYPPETGPFLGYGNHGMAYASAPSVFGDLTPDVPDDVTWYSGSGLYPFKTKDRKEDMAWCKKWGIKSTMYSYRSLTGPSGFEIARRHPEWVARTKTGAFDDSEFTSPSPLELTNSITTRMSEWFGLLPDLYNREALQFGANALVDTIKMFGFDGIFWDGCGYYVGPSYSYKGDPMPNGQDAEDISARNIRVTHETIWKEFPEAYLWYNGADPANVGSFYPSGNGGGRKGKIQMMVDARNGYLHEFQAVQIANPQNAGHSWRSLFEIYLDSRDSIRKKNWGTPLKGIVQTGYVFPSGFRFEITQEEYARTREEWAWANHIISLMAAAQIHFCGGDNAFRPMLQMTTRYSQFFWDENVQIVDKAFKHYEVDSLREVWWEECVYERETEQGRDIIFNIVNSPDAETAHMKIYDDPKPADDVEITCLDIKSTKGVKAWAVRAYDYESTALAPVQETLKPELADGKLVVAVPPFRYFTLVVIRVPKG